MFTSFEKLLIMRHVYVNERKRLESLGGYCELICTTNMAFVDVCVNCIYISQLFIDRLN